MRRVSNLFKEKIQNMDFVNPNSTETYLSFKTNSVSILGSYHVTQNNSSKAEIFIRTDFWKMVFTVCRKVVANMVQALGDHISTCNALFLTVVASLERGGGALHGGQDHQQWSVWSRHIVVWSSSPRCKHFSNDTSRARLRFVLKQYDTLIQKV